MSDVNTNEPSVEPVEPKEPEAPAPELVDKRIAEEYKADMHKYKERAKQLEAEKRDQEMKTLQANEQWKDAYEKEANLRQSVEEKLQKASEGIDYNAKYSAVREAAMKAGIREQAIEDLDVLALDTITVERTSLGKVNAHGADAFIDRLKASKPHWFTDPKAPNVNVNGPEVNVTHKDGSTVTADQILAAEKKGDKTEYLRLMKLKLSQ
jgi:hypothetical protein